MSNQFRIHLIASRFCLILTLSFGCSSLPPSPDLETQLQVDQIITQVSQAIREASELESDAPKISSVQIDLQVNTSSGAKAGLPIFSVPVDVAKSKQQFHQISLSFKPLVDKIENFEQADQDSLNGDSKRMRGKDFYEKQSDLVVTLRSVFRSVKSRGNGFTFQKGSVQIKCVLITKGDAAVKIPLLVPIKFGVDHTSEVIHSITLALEPISEVKTITGSKVLKLE